jgi:hypothetical protein
LKIASRCSDAAAAALLMTLLPASIVAADPKLASLSVLELGWRTWAEIGGLAFAGWFMSSAETLAGWVNGEKEQLLANRLKILRLFVLSLAAGFIAYLVGVMAGMPGILNTISVLLAAYGGEQYLRKKMDAGLGEPKGGK